MLNLWSEKLEYSLSIQQEFDIQILKKHITNCKSIVKTDEKQDKSGVDYIAKLNDGAEILIDAKTRLKGSSKYWKFGEPELALEVYSVVENKKLGWTLNDTTNVDYILYTFDKSDAEVYYFIPFQLLRKAFWLNGKEWAKKYGYKIQASDSWHSSAVFVPASTVIKSVYAQMWGKVV